MILNLSGELARIARAWRPEVYVYDPPRPRPRAATCCRHFRRGRGFRSSFSPRGGASRPRRWSKSPKLVLDRKVQVIHSRDLGALVYGGRRGSRPSVGCASCIRNTRFVHMKRLKRYEYYERIFTFFADELTVVSDSDARHLHTSLACPAAKIRVIPNGVAFADEPILERDERIARRIGARRSASRRIEPGSRAASWLLYLARIHGRKDRITL